jgi:hypothetical protein
MGLDGIIEVGARLAKNRLLWYIRQVLKWDKLRECSVQEMNSTYE